jgi:hypothetical protein
VGGVVVGSLLDPTELVDLKASFPDRYRSTPVLVGAGR